MSHGHFCLLLHLLLLLLLLRPPSASFGLLLPPSPCWPPCVPFRAPCRHPPPPPPPPPPPCSSLLLVLLILILVVPHRLLLVVFLLGSFRWLLASWRPLADNSDSLLSRIPLGDSFPCPAILSASLPSSSGTPPRCFEIL